MNTENKYRLRMEPDQDAESPREWSNICVMVCWHGRYNLGDSQPDNDPQEWRLQMAEACEPGLEERIERYAQRIDKDFGPTDLEGYCKAIAEYQRNAVDKVLNKYFIMLPLYLFDHSGITINTTGFTCPWDSGQVGWVYTSKARAKEEFGWKRMSPHREDHVRQVLKGEVEVYDMFLRGDVWGFILEKFTEDDDGDLDWEEVDSCWGFFGDDPKTNGMADHIDQDLAYVLDDPIRG